MKVLQREADLRAKLKESTDKLMSATQRADAENRLITPEEKAELNGILKEARDLDAQLAAMRDDRDFRDQIAAFGKQEERARAGDAAAQGRRPYPKSLGQQFVDSEAMDWIQSTKGRRPSQWSSPGAELIDGSGLHAATLTTDTASGGDLIVPDYRPGLVDLKFKKLTIADLLASGTTDSNLISYMKETTFTNAAAPVAEAGTKPESTLIFDNVTDPVQKLAHWLPVTEEMLEDVAQTRSIIDGRLRLGVLLTEEDQLLNGSGTAPAIRGLLNRSGLQAAQARGTDTNADAILKQINAILSASYVMPDGIVVNPANWQTVQLAKDANGQYYGSGPFAGPQTPTLWGLPVVSTPSITANTALVGAFRSAAQVFRKGGIRVEASNSHASYFITNMVAIRAEERLALAVYRPGAFGTVTGLN